MANPYTEWHFFRVRCMIIRYSLVIGVRMWHGDDPRQGEESAPLNQQCWTACVTQVRAGHSQSERQRLPSLLLFLCFSHCVCPNSAWGHCLLQQEQDQFISATYIRHLWTPRSWHHINKTPTRATQTAAQSLNSSLFL